MADSKRKRKSKAKPEPKRDFMKSAIQKAMKDVMLHGDYFSAPSFPASVPSCAAPVIKSTVPYEKERLELVTAELNLAMDAEQPNWTYINALDADRKYWLSRQPKSSRGFFGTMFGVPPWMLGGNDDEEDE